MVDPTDGLQYAIGQGYSALDAQAQRSRLDGYAVVSGLTPSAGSSGLEVDIASGSATVGTDGNGDPLTVSNGGTTVTLANADSTNPRKDTIWIDDTGTVQIAQGVAEPAAPSGNDRFDTFSPEPPLVVDGTILAEVWVGAGVTSLSSADVRDRRQPAQIAGEEVAAETLRAATLGRSVDAQGNDITGIGQAEADSVSTTDNRHDPRQQSDSTDRDPWNYPDLADTTRQVITTEDREIYVSPDGNRTGPATESDPTDIEGAWARLPHFIQHDVTVIFENGTYNISTKPFSTPLMLVHGNKQGAELTFKGDTDTPSNVTISGNYLNLRVGSMTPHRTVFEGIRFEIQADTYGSGLTFSNCEFSGPPDSIDSGVRNAVGGYDSNLRFENCFFDGPGRAFAVKRGSYITFKGCSGSVSDSFVYERQGGTIVDLGANSITYPVFSKGPEDGSVESRGFYDAPALTRQNIDKVTVHAGDLVDVAGDATETVFDVSEPVNVLGGEINGPDIPRLNITWADGTTHAAPFERSRGQIQDGSDVYQTRHIPRMNGVTKLTFRNGSPNQQTFGFHVRTI